MQFYHSLVRIQKMFASPTELGLNFWATVRVRVKVGAGVIFRVMIRVRFREDVGIRIG